jgi:hypothetical protein
VEEKKITYKVKPSRKQQTSQLKLKARMAGSDVFLVWNANNFSSRILY